MSYVSFPIMSWHLTWSRVRLISLLVRKTSDTIFTSSRMRLIVLPSMVRSVNKFVGEKCVNVDFSLSAGIPNNHTNNARLLPPLENSYLLLDMDLSYTFVGLVCGVDQGINDLLFVLEYWGECDFHPDDQCKEPRRYCEWGDIDRSGVVDVFDLLFVLHHWGPFDPLEWEENRCF